MKLIACADLHITDKGPTYRKDNYTETIFRKIQNIFVIAEEEKSDALLIAGDVFDSPDIPFSLYSATANIFRKCKVPIIAIPGQHDLRWHTTPLEDTPLGALYKSGIIHIPHRLHNLDNKVVVYGAGWGDGVDETVQADVLLIHTMVTKSGKLYNAQEESEYTTSSDILKKYPNFRFIISGDNHETFYNTNKKRWLINPGSLTRKRKDQVDHSPSVFLIDTTKNTVVRITLNIQPPQDVFDFNKMESDERRKGSKELLDVFVRSVNDTVDSPDFLQVLSRIIKKEVTNKFMLKYMNEKIETAISKIKKGEEDA